MMIIIMFLDVCTLCVYKYVRKMHQCWWYIYKSMHIHTYLVSSVKGFKRLASEDDDKEGGKGNMSNTLHVMYVCT